LDLGVLCGANIAFLGAKGCRVSVESLPRASVMSVAKAAAPGGPGSIRTPGPGDGSRVGAATAPPTPLPPLSYPSDSFSGVLAWDAIARMPSTEATAFVETLRRLLLRGGMILAYFPGPPGNTGGAAGRYRILREDRLAVEPGTQRSVPQPSYQN